MAGPERVQNADNDECIRTYKAAMWCLQHSGVYPAIFFRELAMTERCDHVHDLSRLRKAVYEDLGQDTKKNILNYKEDIVDNRKAYQVYWRYKSWAKDALADAACVDSIVNKSDYGL